MSQEKRFGKRIAMPSTLQIIRELKVLMRHDIEPAKDDVAAKGSQGEAMPVVAIKPSALVAL